VTWGHSLDLPERCHAAVNGKLGVRIREPNVGPGVSRLRMRSGADYAALRQYELSSPPRPAEPAYDRQESRAYVMASCPRLPESTRRGLSNSTRRACDSPTTDRTTDSTSPGSTSRVE